MVAANQSPFAIDGCCDVTTTFFDTLTNHSYTRTVQYIVVPHLGDAVLLGRHAMFRVIGQLDVNNSRAVFDPLALPDPPASLIPQEFNLLTTEGTVIPPGKKIKLLNTYAQ